MSSLLELDGVHTAYGLSRVLFGISLEVKEGECVCLLGRNGVGKTTTMRSVMGLTPPTAGRVRFKSRDVTGWPPYRIARSGIGFSHNRLFRLSRCHRNEATFSSAKLEWYQDRSRWTPATLNGRRRGFRQRDPFRHRARRASTLIAGTGHWILASVECGGIKRAVEGPRGRGASIRLGRGRVAPQPPHRPAVADQRVQMRSGS